MFSVDALLTQFFPQQPQPGWIKGLLRRLLHERECQQFAARYPHLSGLDFVEQVLEHFNFRCDVADTDLEHIPSQGPVVLVANHPIGTLDGLALLRVIARVRPDVKIVANQMLWTLEPLRSLLIPVDNMTRRTARQQIALMRHHLEQNNALILFPAGEVSRMSPKGVRDGRWQSGFLRLAARARAPIVPLHMAGRNSLLFYATSMIYKPLATLLLVREMFAHHSSRIRLRVGARIPYSSWSEAGLPADTLARLFRKHVYLIGHGKPGLFQSEAPIALPEERTQLKRAIEACERLGETPDGKSIYLYRRQAGGHTPILRELGRLREIAFRAVGEGTGRRRDLDAYDDDYYHLVLWDPADLEIVGAYRFIPTGEQLARKGMAGLYTHSLFHYDESMSNELAQGLELGRSFIQPAYWGRRSLDYLWQGIGAFLARNPQYRYLFGPVSISAGFPTTARDLLVSFYRLHFPPRQELARSRRPYYPASLPKELKQFDGSDYVADLTRLKSMLDNLGCAIPTLYKQYSELCEPGGVQFIDFGTDPDFADCIDGLVLVDLEYLKAGKRQRYIDIHSTTTQADHAA